MKVVGQISNYLQKDDTVVFLGDLIDSYGESLKKMIYSAAFFSLKTWASRCKHIYVLVGNHDIYRGMSFLRAFDEIPNVTVIMETTNVEIDGYSADLVPWLCQIPDKKGDLLFAHLMPVGAQLGALYRARAEEGVNIQKFGDYRYVILGHCHEPQEIPVPHSQTIVQCIGSILQLNLSSSSAPRYIYRLSNNKWSRTEITSPKIHSVTIETQKDADDFFKNRNKTDYYKLIATDHTIQFPQLDHTVVVEFAAKPRAGVQEVEDVQELDLLETINEFIENSNTKIDKKLAKECLAKLY
jgi:DNA repair exonuclease SbcCD nuclease subunit